MDEFDLELEQNRKRPVQIVKKGGWLGKIVALLLGIVIGFVGCFGAIAAVVYYFVGVMKIEEGAGYLKSILGDDFEYTDYIAEEYGDKTTLDLISSTLTAAQTVMDGTGTLNTLNEIYPMLYTLVAGEENPDPNAMFNGLVPLLQQYGLDVDADTMMKLIINGTGGETLAPDLYLGDYIMDKTYDLAIGDLLQMSGFQASPIIDALFFGEENVDYTVNADGWKEPLEGGTPWLTLEDLLFSETDVIGERIGSLALASVMSIKTNNNIMMTLAYGNSSRYTVKGSKVTMNQQVYTFDNTCFYDDNGEKVDGTVDELENGVYSLTTDGTTLYLKESDKNDSSYLAYTDEACSKKALYKKTTINDLEDDPNQLINRMELGSTLKLTPSSNKVLLALAYGTEGEDYDVINGKIKMRGGKKERTFGDLINGGDKLIEDVRLADVMEADNDDAIMMYLLYGKQDTHYKLVGDSALNSELTPVPLQKQIAVLDYNDVKTPYNVYGDTQLDGTINEEITTYTVDGVTYYLSPVSKTVNITVKNASNEDEDVASNLYYVYEDEAKQIPVMFEPTSLGELMNDSSIISNLTGRLTLEEVMGKEASLGPMEKLGGSIIDEVPDKIETLQLKDIFDEEDLENSKILSNLGESTLASLSEDVDKLTFSNIFTEDEVKDNNVLTYLYNAKDPETEELYPITELTKAIDAMAVTDVFSPTEINSNPILKSLTTDKNGEKVLIKNMSARLDELTLGDVFGDEIYVSDGNGGYKTEWIDKVDENGDPILDENGDPEQEEVYLIDPTANHVLAALHDRKVSELSTAMNDLTVGDIFAHEIYLHETTTDENGNPIEDQYHFAYDSNGKRIVDPNANSILVCLKDCPINQMNTEVETLTVGDVFEDDIYDESGDVKGNWYYLLKDTREFIDADGDGQKDDANPKYGEPHDEYKLTSEMNVMMENMSANMETASLKELNDKGIIDLSDNELLNDDKEIPYDTFGIPKYEDKDGNEKTYFNQLTVYELFDFVGKIIP